MKVGESIQHKKTNQDDNLIPLINIVFLMLIFFMVAGHISESDPIKVQPASSISNKQNKQEAIVIVIAADGQVAFEQELMAKAELEKHLNERFDAARDKQAFSLLVKVDADLPVDKLQSVLNVIRQNGIKRVSLATQKRTDAA